MSADLFWQKFWDAKATEPTDFRATGRGGMEVPDFLYTVGEAARLLDLGPQDRVLDAGCGSGIFALALAPWVKAVKGVDLSPGMIERARANGAGVANLSFEVAPITALPVPDQSIDKLLAYSVLQYLGGEAAVTAAFKEVKRVLRRGGKALLAANPDPARHDAFIAAVMAKPDETMRRIEIDLVARTLWIAPSRLSALAEECGLAAQVAAIHKRIWQHFYMYDLVVSAP